MKNKNKNYSNHSRIYLWHRFEQVEADCYEGKYLSTKGKQISLKLMGYLLAVGVAAETLTEKDISDMTDIINTISETMPELIVDDNAI